MRILPAAPVVALMTLVVAPAPATGLPLPPLLELPELCTFTATGRNPYFILEPGWTLELEGVEDGETIRVTSTVLDETRIVDGVETRVLFEEETADRELVEHSWNWFAICIESGSVFYFGEQVDIYEDGQIVSHEGSWEAGKDLARPGIIMPGEPAVGQFHFQEIAPLVAMDTGLVTSTTEHVDVPAGAFDDCVHVLETNPLEPGSLGDKSYAPGIGLAVDDVLELVRFGFGH